MNRSSLLLFLFLGAATFCFQAISGVGIGLLEIPLKCYMRLDHGEGNQRLIRYHYNDKNSQCLRFYYGGRKGNGNNFESLDECIKVCKGSPPDNVIPSNLILTIPGSTKVEAKRTGDNNKNILNEFIIVWIRNVLKNILKNA